MSRILVKIVNGMKSRRRVIKSGTAALLFMAGGLGFLTGKRCLSIICYILLGIFITNLLVIKKMRFPAGFFNAKCKVRNVDYLIIGDLCNPHLFIPEKASYIQISAPGRSLPASFEILRHTTGILKENGTAVIVDCGNRNKKGSVFSVFDIPILSLSPVSIKYLQLEKVKRKSYFPILFAPIGSIRLLLNLAGGNLLEVFATDAKFEEMARFCGERDIRLKLYSTII